jgi:hypothetical protein
MAVLGAALAVLAAGCSGDATPAATTAGPSLTTVPPIGSTVTTVPSTGPTTSTVAPSPTRPPTTGPIDEPKPGVERFIPELDGDGDTLALDVVFLDGSVARVEWPAEIDIVSRGLVPYGWAYIAGRSSRDFFIRPGPVEDVLERLGGAELVSQYPAADGSLVGLWRPQADDVDYLAFQFGNWTVLVFDYRNDFRMTEEIRALWATNLTGQTSEDGYLVLSAEAPLQLVYAGDYPDPANMTMLGADGTVKLVPGTCTPGPIDPIDGDARASWCDEGGKMTIEAYGTDLFQHGVDEGLVVRSTVIVEPPPPPETDE